MPRERRPIDDPEVRQQHRRQTRRQLRSAVVGAVIFVSFLLCPVALGTVTDAAFGTRLPATVVSVDDAGGTVTVSSSDADLPGYSMFEVHDTGAYAAGDHVGVIVSGEERKPVGLDREPIVPQLLEVAVAWLVFAVIASLIATMFVSWITLRRRRALHRPWRRVSLTLFDEPPRQFVRLPDDHGATYWKLEDLPAELPANATHEAQVAGGPRRLVVRFFGSTQLATARRKREQEIWTERFAAAEDQPTGVSAISEPRCTSVGVSDPRSSSSSLASRK